MKHLKCLLIPVLALSMVACAGFVNGAKKTLYVSGTLADGAMRVYAADWKDRTNRLGDTASLENERSNVMVLSRKVGAGIALADKAVDDYSAAAGTNAPNKVVVNALITTAVSDAGSFAAYITALTGKSNFTVSPFTPLK